MRRLLLGASVLLLGGCSGSGFWTYEHDTIRLPWDNPNTPVSASDNFQRSLHGMVATSHLAATQPVLLTESGDIWPGAPAPVPTLKDLQKQQMAEINNTTGGEAGLSPLPPLPSLPGYEISPQEPGHAAPKPVYTGSAVGLPGGRAAPLTGGQEFKELGGGGGSTPAPIIVPNGNGTSTVIGPTGTVTTIPTPPK